MIHLLVGVRSVGKTTLADHLASASGLSHVARFSPRNTLPLTDADHVLRTREQVETAIVRPWTRLTVIPDTNVNEIFDLMANRLKQWYLAHEAQLVEHGGLAVLVDEARFSAVRDSEAFDYLVRCGDREAVHVLLTVHRPVDIHPDIRGIVDFWYVFNVTGPRDLDVIADHCDLMPIDKVSSLREREFFQYRTFGAIGPNRCVKWTQDRATIWAPKGKIVRRAERALLEPVDAEAFDLE